MNRRAVMRAAATLAGFGLPTQPRGACAAARPTGRLIFLGHAGFQIISDAGDHVLIDPWIHGNPALPIGWRPPEKLSAVLITHGHTDHLDADLGTLLATTRAKLIAPTPVAEHVQARSPGVEIVEINKGGTITISDFTITMVDAVHEAWLRDADGRITVPHQGAGFVLRLGNGHTLYHAGDTGLFEGMALIARLYRPRLALLPIGGRHTMDPEAAALACELLGAQVVVPMHFGTFDFLEGTPTQLAQALARRRATTRMVELRPGATMTLARL